MYKEVVMTEGISADFLEAFGLTEADVEEAQNANTNSGDTDANPDAQTGGQDSVNTTTETQGTDASNQNSDVTGQNDQQNQQTSDSNQQQNSNQQSLDAQEYQRQVRQNAAFAQMRTENSALRKMVGDIAGVLGIDPNTPQDQMQHAVQDAIIKAQAKKQGMDPVVLQKIAQLEQYKEANERQSLSNKALMGFQAVKNQFNLSDKDVDAFADQLMRDGVNPFTRNVDLVSEYKLRNFDALIEAATQKGAAQEAQRQANVAAHSSQPNNTSGGSAGANDEPEKITSVAGLTNWFEKNSAN